MVPPIVLLSAFFFILALSTALVPLPPPHLPPLLPQILTGALLGPPLLSLPPFPAALQLLGLLGVSLSILTTGLETPLPSLIVSLPRGLSVAVLGLLGPALAAFATILLTSLPVTGASLRAAAAAAAALAPTSLGVVDSLLRRVGEDATPLGRLIAVAAVLDDMLSLILLSVVGALAETPIRAWSLASPPVYAAVFAFGMLGFAVYALEPLWRASTRAGRFVFEKVGVAPPGGAVVGVWVLAAAAVGAVYLAEVAGTSFLFAVYLVGIAFAGRDGVKEEWARVVEPVIPPLLGLFFAATTGFEIPLKALFKGSAIALGAGLGVCGVLGKMLAGLAVKDVKRDGLAVAVAMLGRGEFGFLIAIEALRTGLLDDETYAAVVWGVLIPTILTPIAFGPVFERRKRSIEAGGMSTLEGGSRKDNGVAVED